MEDHYLALLNSRRVSGLNTGKMMPVRTPIVSRSMFKVGALNCTVLSNAFLVNLHLAATNWAAFPY
jgi:hypothetical protein